MQSDFTEITYDVELQAGESFSLPKEIAEIVGPGHWLVSIRPARNDSHGDPIRDHASFLNSYASEDEGLYDDLSSRSSDQLLSECPPRGVGSRARQSM